LSVDLHFNTRSAFTRWIVSAGHLRQPFVVLDVGVQGGENPRWHLLGDHLVVYGLDAIKEVIEDLQERNSGRPTRHYLWFAAGNVDEQREFYFNAADPRSSSFYRQGADRFGFSEKRIDESRVVAVRRLDTLLREGVITAPDFLKNDVEGLEKEVFLGAQEVLTSVLGVECESSFSISPVYPNGHFTTLQDMLIQQKLVAFDLNFNRIPRGRFQEALVRKGLPAIAEPRVAGKPATLNVLFCRDPIDEADHSENYVGAFQPMQVDQLLKTMIIYELHGLNDIALDTAERFREELGARLDVDKAVDLLVDPDCMISDNSRQEVHDLRLTNAALLSQMEDMRHLKSWRYTAPLRAIRGLFNSSKSLRSGA
jgi:FkbM family methyltransferase